MHTPSHTKLKGDLLLELRDIRLEINKENTTLEKVRADRAFAEKSFKDREERVSEREKVNSRLEEKFDSVAGDAEKWLEVVKKNTKIERESRNMLESENKQIRDDTNFIKVIKIGVIEQLNKEIEDKITLKNSLENNIKDAKEELVKLELKKIKLLQKNKEIANQLKQNVLKDFNQKV